jgi:phosphohistidine phosphatase SixA
LPDQPQAAGGADRVEVRVEPALGGEPFDVHEITAGLDNVLLVGHDPSFSLLLHVLTGAQARMKKGGVAAISKGELVVLLRPLELAAIGATDAAIAG